MFCQSFRSSEAETLRLSLQSRMRFCPLVYPFVTKSFVGWSVGRLAEDGYYTLNLILVSFSLKSSFVSALLVRPACWQVEKCCAIFLFLEPPELGGS